MLCAIRKGNFAGDYSNHEAAGSTSCPLHQLVVPRRVGHLSSHDDWIASEVANTLL